MTLQADTSIAAGDGQVAAAALTAARSEAAGGDPQALVAERTEAAKVASAHSVRPEPPKECSWGTPGRHRVGCLVHR